MLLSICITSYRNPELLKLCIDSIRSNISITDYEIIVADSATQEDTEIMMREEYPEITFFTFRENVGFPALVKSDLEVYRGDYVLLLNGDLIIPPGSVEKLLDFMQSDARIGVTGPKLLNFNETLQYSCFRFYNPWTIVYRRTFLGKFGFAQKNLDWFLMKDYDHQKTKEVDWLMGSAIMLSSKALKEVGFIDPQFFMYMEDVDWCRRFWEKGFRVIYYPEAVMHHYHGKGSAKGGVVRSLLSNQLTWVHIASALKYFRKYRGKPLPKHN